MKHYILLAYAIAASFVMSGSADSETAGEFYENKTIRLIVPYRPGGGYDEYARLLEPFLETYTGARVDIVNMPGGGGLKGFREIHSSPNDGLHFGFMNGPAMVRNEIVSNDISEYELAEFSYLGRITAEERVLVVATNSEFSGIEDILVGDKLLIVGVTGRGGATYVDAEISGMAFGFNQKIVAGFDSSSDVRLALLRGDVDASWGSLGTQLKSIAAGEGKPVLRNGTANAPELDGVMKAGDLARGVGASGAVLIEAWTALINVGRLMAGPPGIPEDRLKFLQDALDQSMTDPGFLASAAAANRGIDFLDGEETRNLVLRAVRVDDATRAALTSALKGE